jgi:uncharacterized membrane protein
MASTFDVYGDKVCVRDRAAPGALLSYVFGTIVIAASINLAPGLVQ